MKKTLLVVFSAALALVLLSSGLANTENKLNASSEDSEATQATNSLVVISSESDGSPNGNSAVLAVIDDVLVGTNPSPIVPMGAYKMDDPSSCGLEASEAANDGDIIDEIPDNLKPSPLLSMGIYEINGDDFAALWAGETPDYLFAKIDAEDFESVGHLIDLAENAAARLNDAVPGGAGAEINEMIAGFKSEKAAADPEYLEVTAMVGQVINVARPFYNRLHEVDGVVWPDSLDFIGGNGKYPWPDFSENAEDSEKINYYAFAKKGQAKNLFAWNIETTLLEKSENNDDSSGIKKEISQNTGIGVAINQHFSDLLHEDATESKDEVFNTSSYRANEGDLESKKVISIYEYAGAIRVNTAKKENWAQTDGNESIWNNPNPQTYHELFYITLGYEYTVQNCFFLSYLPGHEKAGHSMCYGATPSSKNFSVPIPVTYYTKTHTCVNQIEGSHKTTYGEATMTTSLLSNSAGGDVHGYGTPHNEIRCGTSFAPWVWDIEKSQQESRKILFGRQYQSNDNTQGKRVIKVDHGGEDIIVECTGNFSVETKETYTSISTPSYPITGKTAEITITPGAVAGQYEGKLTIISKDAYANYREEFTLYHVGDSGRVSTYPLSESSGPKYRKVSLTGRPINDDKPQAEDESDFTPPETFVDALSQNLRHNVNDYIQPIPTSNDLVLAVRRNYTSEVWNPKTGLQPIEREDLPFGKGWSSNIVSFVELQYQDDYAESTEPDYAIVTDESGMPFRFAMVSSESGRKFYPLPNDRSDAQAFLNTLVEDADGNLVFKKKYGTTLTFKPSGIPMKAIPCDRLKPVSLNNVLYSYYRLHEVKDRLGNTLRYEYDDAAAKKLIPNKIWNVLPTGVTSVALNIQQNSSGLVEKVTCPMGLELHYEYENGNLKSVRKGGAEQPNVFTYSYLTHSEPNVFKFMYPDSDYNDYSYSHFDLGSIADGAGNEYVFDYKDFTYYCIVPDENIDRRGGGVYSRQGDNYYVPSGGCGRVSKVTVKQNGSVLSEASFSDNSTILLEKSGSLSSAGIYGGESSVSGTRRMTVTDGEGNKVVYSWQYPSGDSDLAASAVVYSLDSFSDIYGFGPDSPFVSPSMVYYRCMTIDYQDSTGGSLGTEKVTFDINAGMAISSHTDMYGNTTTFAYDDLITLADSDKGLYYASKYSDPTSQTDALGNVTEFTYDANTRIMTSVKKKSAGATGYDRQTVWTVDSIGRRTNEKIYDSAGELIKETINRYRTDTMQGFLLESIVYDDSVSGGQLKWSYNWDEYGNASGISFGGHTEYIMYDANGLKKSYMAPGGNITRYTNDNSLRRLIGITNPDNTSKSFTYDILGRKLSETDENGNTKFYEYNALHKITSETRPLGTVTHTEYNALGLPVKVTDPNGNIVKYEYDALMRLVKKTSYSGDTAMGIISYEYGANSGSNLFSTDDFKPTRITNSRGYITEKEYDGLYRLIKSDEEYAKQDDPNISYYEGDGIKTTAYSYDMFGNKTSETDDNGNTTSYEYNALDKLVKTTFADGSTKTAVYSPYGLLRSETDEMGNTIDYTYYSDGRMSSKKYPSVFNYATQSESRPSELYAYDSRGNLTEKTNAFGQPTFYYYNSRNWLIKEEKPSINVGESAISQRPTTVITYDNVGNRKTVTDPNGNTTSYDYDALNRLVKTTYPSVPCTTGATGANISVENVALTETNEYDANGNRTRHVSTGGIQTFTTYNYLNKPVEVKKGSETSPSDVFEYDTEGNLVGITDIGGVKTEYAYDGLNRRTMALYNADADANIQRKKEYIYDGLNIKREDPANVYYYYDSRNRLIQSFTGFFYHEAYNYYELDACSRIKQATTRRNSEEWVSYTYDGMGRILTEKNNNKTHEYQYDLLGNPCYEKYDVSGNTFSHSLEKTYYSNNLLKKTTDEDGNSVSYYYDLNFNLVSKIYSSGVKVLTEYDALNRPVSIRSVKDGIDLEKTVYTYDKSGNVATISQICGEQSQSLRMGYDTYDRLNYEVEEVTEGASTYSKNQSWYFSGYNLTTRSIYDERIGGNNSYYFNYHSNSRFIDSIGINSAEPNKKITYDALGNIYIIKDPKSNRISEYFYFDGFGRLYQYLNCPTESSSDDYSYYYVYDYRGRRLSYATNKKKTNYYYSGGTSVMENTVTPAYGTPASSETILYYRGSDKGGGVGGINYTRNSGSAELNFKHYNLRGDVIATTDSSGNIVSHSIYETYGKHIDYGTIPSDRHRANTKVEDSETNLLLEGYRYRHLEYGIYMSPDPLEYVDGLNFYAYCGFNPWGRWDPLGLQDKKENDDNQNDADIGVKMNLKPADSTKNNKNGSVEVTGEVKGQYKITKNTTVEGSVNGSVKLNGETQEVTGGASGEATVDVDGTKLTTKVGTSQSSSGSTENVEVKVEHPITADISLIIIGSHVWNPKEESSTVGAGVKYSKEQPHPRWKNHGPIISVGVDASVVPTEKGVNGIVKINMGVNY